VTIQYVRKGALRPLDCHGPLALAMTKIGRLSQATFFRHTSTPSLRGAQRRGNPVVGKGASRPLTNPHPRHCEGRRPVAIQTIVRNSHGPAALKMTGRRVKNPPCVCANVLRVWMNPPRVCANTLRVWMNLPRVCVNALRVWMNPPRVCVNALRVWMNLLRVCVNARRVWMNLPCVCANARCVCIVLPLLKGVSPCPPLTGSPVAVKHKSP
jgi:hypothetical protein